MCSTIQYLLIVILTMYFYKFTHKIFKLIYSYHSSI